MPVGGHRWVDREARTPGRRWAWQTTAWSGSKIDPAAVLYQRVVEPGPESRGQEVDVNDVPAEDCGQWNLHR